MTDLSNSSSGYTCPSCGATWSRYVYEYQRNPPFIHAADRLWDNSPRRDMPVTVVVRECHQCGGRFQVVERDGQDKTQTSDVEGPNKS